MIPSTIIDDALALPPGERARLAVVLLESVDGPASAEIERSWILLAKERLADHQRDGRSAIADHDLYAELEHPAP